MTGDVNEIVDRIQAVLPERWFPRNAPTLRAVTTGSATAWWMLRDMISCARSQIRLRTASGAWLDGYVVDFFGSRLQRRSRERDDTFRSRVIGSILREKVTRRGLCQSLIDLTGRSPIVFEPARPTDTGGWGQVALTGTTGFGFGLAGGWGSLCHHHQVFVIAFRPLAVGDPSGLGWGAGGYNVGHLAYGDLDLIRGRITDDDIYATVHDTAPAGVTVWTRISG
jgi:hypothetical protein